MNEEIQPQPPILASDAERERSIAVLRDGVGEGRLTLEEFSHRLDLVHSARTDLELAEVVRDLPAQPQPSSVQPVAAQHRAFCSHLVREGRWALPARSSWRSIFGTIDLDLRQAHLEDSHTVLEVYNLFGTVTVLVPDGIAVSVTGGGLFASQKVEAPMRHPDADGPRLTVAMSGPGGTLHVKRSSR